MTLIQQYLPEYTVSEHHSIEIAAPADAVYPVAKNLDFNDSRITRWLFRLRGLPADDLRLQVLTEKMRFRLIEECPPKELLIIAIGNAAIIPQTIADGVHFRQFKETGHIKIAWNFELEQTSAQHTRLHTETRVQCLGSRMKWIFYPYWALIRPFSGWIRLEMLRIAKQQAESEWKDGSME